MASKCSLAYSLQAGTEHEMLEQTWRLQRHCFTWPWAHFATPEVLNCWMSSQASLLINFRGFPVLRALTVTSAARSR